MFDLMNGIGAHEVIIENPAHDLSLSGISVPQFADVLYAYRDRIN